MERARTIEALLCDPSSYFHKKYAIRKVKWPILSHIKRLLHAFDHSKYKTLLYNCKSKVEIFYILHIIPKKLYSLLVLIKQSWYTSTTFVLLIYCEKTYSANNPYWIMNTTSKRSSNYRRTDRNDERD